MHPMKRKLLIVLLGAGTVLGYGAGFASMRWHAHHRRAAFERHVADTCVDAALRGGGRGGDHHRRGDGSVAPR